MQSGFFYKDPVAWQDMLPHPRPELLDPKSELSKSLDWVLPIGDYFLLVWQQTIDMGILPPEFETLAKSSKMMAQALELLKRAKVTAR